MRLAWNIVYEGERWEFCVGFSLMCFGVGFLVHIVGDFGFQIMLGPLGIVLQRSPELVKKELRDESNA